MEQETKKTVRFHIIAVLLIIIFCIGITPKTFQNDTFYTIKIGEYVTKNGVTMQEPFAWHENLKYTFPHWLYDVMIYTFYSIGGFAGIYLSTIAFVIILGLLMYYINVRLSKNNVISFLITIITMYLMQPFVCARAQLITFILFLLTVYFIERFLQTRKIGYAIGLIIIPILIANLHVATFYFYFIIYLPYLAECGIYILSYCNPIICKSKIDTLKKKIYKEGESEELTKELFRLEEKYAKLLEKQDKKIQEPYKIKISYSENTKWLILIFIICIFAGLVTPLGDVPYTYLIKTMQGISTKNINEHLPVILANNQRLLVLFLVYISITAFTKIKVKITDVFMILGLSLLAIFTRRQASMLYLIGSIVLTRMITDFILVWGEKEKVKKINDFASKIPIILIVTIIITAWSFNKFKNIVDDNYVDESMHPVQAAEWLKENLDVNNIKLYNSYNFGSYLIYKDIPVFIDSRCDLYMPEFNENIYVFKDFLDLNNYNFTDMESKIDEYGFTHFIVNKNTRIQRYLSERPKEYKKIYPTGDIQDDVFTIYERIK